MSRFGAGQVVVAAGQMPAYPLGRAAESLACVRRLAAQAARQRVDLLVLPECAYPAYAIGSAAGYRRARHLDHRGFLAELAGLARQHGLHIVCGFVEDTGEALYNSAAVISPAGELCGIARKSFLWMMDTRWFAAADRLRPIDTALGRIGVAICADNRAPEVAATLVARGAEIIVAPTCWLDASSDGQGARNPQPEFMIASRAREFGVAHVCADKVGRERARFSYVGRSMIALPDGSVPVMADESSEALIVTAIGGSEPRVAEPAEGVRDRLLAPSTNRRVRRPAARPLTLAAFPGAMACAGADAGSPGRLFEMMARRGVALSVSHVPQPAVAAQVRQTAKGHRVAFVGAPGGDGVTRIGDARVGLLNGDSIVSFAAARALALDGAEVLCVFAPSVPIGTLRTRAVENRVFVVAVADEQASLIDPAGHVLAQADGSAAEPLVQTVDLADAAHKRVAPLTDLWQQRRPALYEF